MNLQHVIMGIAIIVMVVAFLACVCLYIHHVLYGTYVVYVKGVATYECGTCHTRTRTHAHHQCGM